MKQTSTLDVGQKIHPVEILDPAWPAKHWARRNQENSRPPTQVPGTQPQRYRQ